MSHDPISVVGVSHRTAPLPAREPFALARATVRRLLEEHADERLVLVTCNRTELYGTEPTATLRERFLAAAGARDEGAVFAFEGEAAARHLFEVAAGLDSMVIGEPQILGQVKRAMKEARRADSLGPVLDELARRALSVGRRVRRETALGRGAPSIPKVATGVARLVLGELDGRAVLVVGTGKMGGLTARALAGAGAGAVVVVNRTTGPATALAERIGGRAEPWERLDELLSEVDVAIASTAAREPILTRDRLATATAGRRARPLVVVDIAVPRDVEAAARSLDTVRLYDLDDLRGWGSNAVPPGALEEARRVVEDEAVDFTAWQKSRAAIPTIRALRARGKAILAAELERAPAAEREAFRRFGRRLMRKLLHEPTVRLRDRTAAGGDRAIEAARDLFGLDGEDDRAGGGEA